ncbi:MAG TPA: hypothetical protein VGO67_18435 [Verrucomicrobiae bacterium]|jgi:hypothetical protein
MPPTHADLSADYSNLSQPQCDEFHKIQFQEALDRNGGSVDRATKSVAALFPSLVARKKFFSDQAFQAIQNDDVAWRAAIPQLSQDVSELYRNIEFNDDSAVWKACGNSYTPSQASTGFDTLVGCYAKRNGGDYVAAEQDVRTKFKALSALADSQKVAAKLGVELPPENGGFSPKTGLHTPGPDPSTAKDFKIMSPFDVKKY